MDHLKIFLDTVIQRNTENIEHIKVMMKLISMFSKNVNLPVKETTVIPTMMSNQNSQLSMKAVTILDFTTAMLTHPMAMLIFRQRTHQQAEQPAVRDMPTMLALFQSSLIQVELILRVYTRVAHRLILEPNSHNVMTGMVINPTASNNVNRLIATEKE